MARVNVEPFSIDVDEEVLDDLRTRLGRTRWPGAAPGEPWAQGTDLCYLRELVEYWRDGFDWRAAERALNAVPQFIADADGVRVHFVHVRRGGIPLVLTHGWPSAFTEAVALVERLPGFDLVIPSLPGYAFSSRPSVCTTPDVAALWHTLMQGLGYERYAAGGGDWGAAVTTYMALSQPGRMLGIHLSNLDNAPPPDEPLSEAERTFLAASARWDATQRGYSTIQSTQPQTLAYGLTDSPVGLAAWITEKWRSWADPECPIDRDFLLTLITLYWVTDTIVTANRDYIDNYSAATPRLDAYVGVRTAIARFHRNQVSEGLLPREWAERLYNVERFTDMPRGGHFAAAEAPDLLAADIAAFFTRHGS
jgi:pimeloyl-ACP methyl ester carboxylesterase